MVENVWFGENPLFLIIRLASGEGIGIDLDEPGWIAKNAEYLRSPGTWTLNNKKTSFRHLSLVVLTGEQPYYVARHLGMVGSGGGNELIAYGLGKKRLDGHVDRLWLMPDGSVCAGDDAEVLGREMLEEMGPR
jgi:hypothetical protein